MNDPSDGSAHIGGNSTFNNCTVDHGPIMVRMQSAGNFYSVSFKNSIVANTPYMTLGQTVSGDYNGFYGTTTTFGTHVLPNTC